MQYGADTILNFVEAMHAKRSQKKPNVKKIKNEKATYEKSMNRRKEKY